MNILEGMRAVSNVHPLFVHFPVALLMVAGILFIACRFFDSREMLIVAKWDLILGSLASVAAATTGLIAASTIPHNQEIHEAMETHESIMICVAVLSLGLSGYLFYKKDPSLLREQNFFLAGLILLLGLLTVGADFGGKMVFKYGAGTKLFEQVNPDAAMRHDHGEETGNHEHDDHDH